ncbi:Arylsulfatase [compost metagenome]
MVSMAMDWIKQQTEAAPFALRVDTWGPHHSFQVPLAFKDLINPEEIEEYPSFTDDMKHRPQFVRNFLEGIRNRNHLQTWNDWQPLMKRAYEHYSYIDAAVGRLLDLLEERGIAENTVVIYTADHGDALGSHGGMVDKAGDLMEEVMHIPMVIRWPGVTGGEQSNALVSNLDLVPTVLDMAGITPPEYMDGQSLTSLLQGNAGGREDLMAEHYGHFKVQAAQRVLYFQQYKYIATQGAAHELYDLEKDPFELDNRSDAPEMREILREMQRRLLDNMDRHGDRGEGASDIRGQLNI